LGSKPKGIGYEKILLNLLSVYVAKGWLGRGVSNSSWTATTHSLKALSS